MTLSRIERSRSVPPLKRIAPIGRPRRNPARCTVMRGSRAYGNPLSRKPPWAIAVAHSRRRKGKTLALRCHGVALLIPQARHSSTSKSLSLTMTWLRQAQPSSADPLSGPYGLWRMARGPLPRQRERAVRCALHPPPHKATADRSSAPLSRLRSSQYKTTSLPTPPRTARLTPVSP
jgi:hypothetical protein